MSMLRVRHLHFFVLSTFLKLLRPVQPRAQKTFFSWARISVIWDRVIKMWRSMSKQNFIADSIFAFLSPCLLFIMSKSAVDCRTFQSSHYSNQNRTVIGGDSVQNGWFRVVLPIVTHLQCVLSTLQSRKRAKITQSKTGFCHFVEIGKFRRLHWALEL